MNNQTSLFKFPEEPKAILKDIRNFLAGRAIGITRDEALLEEVIKILFCLKSSVFKATKLNSNEVENALLLRKVFKQITLDYPEFYGKNEEILLDPQSLSYVAEGLEKAIGYKQRKFDIVGDCYELFIGNSIKGQEGQFFTPSVAVNSLIEAVNPKPTWKIIDTACGASGFLSALYLYFSNNYSQTTANKFVESNLFGIEKDSTLTRLGKIHLTLLSGKKPNIFNGDSLAMNGEKSLSSIKDGEFDLVITNPPFGAKIKAANEETLQKFELGHKWIETNDHYQKNHSLVSNIPPQTLFTERNIKVIKPGGIFASVIPESLVSNKNYKHVIQYILSQCQILGIFGMPESLFKTSGKGGTHTKTCLLIAKKRKEQEMNGHGKSYNFFLAEARWCGHDSRANNIPKNDLPKILRNYINFMETGEIKPSSLGYSLSTGEIEDNILAPRYYDIGFQKLKLAVSKTHHMVTIGELVKENVLDISTGDEVGKLAYGEGIIPYVRTSDISNWEIKIDVKQRISEDVYNKLKHKQDIREGDILMVKDGTYLIGTVAYISKLDVQMVYQSHIYKIRVSENNIGLTPSIFLGLLSSDFVQRQIKSKQLTQDIIDSLGRRIYDLVIPIPKNEFSLQKINDLIETTLKLREESKLKSGETMKHINFLFS